MEGIIIGIIILACLAVIAFLTVDRKKPGHKGKANSLSEFPYQKVSNLLTAAEQSFYRTLLASIDLKEKFVFAKIRLEDLIEVKKGTDNRLSYHNKVSSKHIDFVLCDAKTFAPLLAIELNDSSHSRSDRKERDEFLDKALDTASLPLLWVEAKRNYVPNELRRLVQDKLSLEDGGLPSERQASNVINKETTAVVSSTASGTTSSAAEMLSEQASEAIINDSVPGENSIVICPRCGSIMVERANKRTGSRFLGCSQYPKCHAMLALPNVPVVHN